MKNILFLFLLLSATSYALDADYNGGEELIMTERDGSTSEYRRKKIYDLSVPLYSIYWNPSNNQYYYVKDGSDLIKTNGLTYKLDPKKEEQIFIYETKDPYLQFAGYVSPKERLYIDKRNKKQYIKSLIPIQDPFEVVPYKTVFKEDGSYSRKTFGDLMDKGQKEHSVSETSYYDAPSQEGFSRSSYNGEI